MAARSILAVIDFSHHSGDALQRAALLCVQHRAALTLVYLACPGEAHPTDAVVRLAQHALQLRRRHAIPVRAATRVACGVDDVAAEAKGADLVVWATTPVRGVRAWFSAHPVIRLLRACPRPVIVVHNPADQAYRRVMVAVDFSQASPGMVALGMALNPSARVELFHAVHTMTEGKLRQAQVADGAIQAWREQIQRDARNQLFTLTDSFATRRNRLAGTIGRGDPARQVLVQQQNNAADLVVVGKHAASGLSDFVFDSVAQRLLRHAPCDVLVVPHNVQRASRAAAVARLASAPVVRRVRCLRACATGEKG